MHRRANMMSLFWRPTNLYVVALNFCYVVADSACLNTGVTDGLTEEFLSYYVWNLLPAKSTLFWLSTTHTFLSFPKFLQVSCEGKQASHLVVLLVSQRHNENFPMFHQKKCLRVLFFTRKLLFFCDVCEWCTAYENSIMRVITWQIILTDLTFSLTVCITSHTLFTWFKLTISLYTIQIDCRCRQRGLKKHTHAQKTLSQSV